MTCVLYARVSTDKQAEKELSLPAQLQAMRDYARVRQASRSEAATLTRVREPMVQLIVNVIKNSAQIRKIVGDREDE